MKHRYIRELHDAILTEMNRKFRRTDQEIADKMGFSKQTVSENRNRLGLPVNARPRPLPMAIEKPVPTPKERPDPLSVAQKYLPGFDRETLTLRGKPIRLDDAMRKTNAILKAWGIPQVGPEKWRV